MTEAILRHLSKDRIEVLSAGSAPHPDLHPTASSTLETKFGINAADLRIWMALAAIRERIEETVALIADQPAPQIRP